QNLPVPSACDPAMGWRDGEPLPGQDGRENDTGVLTGETHPPHITVNVLAITINATADQLAADVAAFISAQDAEVARYLAELDASFYSSQKEVRAWGLAEITAGAS